MKIYPHSKNCGKVGRPVEADPLLQRQIRVSDSQWVKWKKAAQKANQKLSEWIRSSCDRCA